MRKWLKDNKFLLNTYPEGRFWERRTGRWSCMQVDEGLTTFIVCEDSHVYSVNKEQFKAAIPQIQK